MCKSIKQALTNISNKNNSFFQSFIKKPGSFTTSLTFFLNVIFINMGFTPQQILQRTRARNASFVFTSIVKRGLLKSKILNALDCFWLFLIVSYAQLKLRILLAQPFVSMLLKSLQDFNKRVLQGAYCSLKSKILTSRLILCAAKRRILLFKIEDLVALTSK